jgi:hypothetical protein
MPLTQGGHTRIASAVLGTEHSNLKRRHGRIAARTKEKKRSKHFWLIGQFALIAEDGFRSQPPTFSCRADEAISFRFPPICASPQALAETFPQEIYQGEQV